MTKIEIYEMALKEIAAMLWSTALWPAAERAQRALLEGNEVNEGKSD